MNEKQATALRAPFAPEQIGKLPRLTCKPCSEAPNRVCSSHEKTRCRECGSYISNAHMHLDYVGHAAATDRLLQVDPEWTWEPVAFGEHGEPFLTPDGLWIKLTICGVTRYGFGDGTSVKEQIGDAIRNAAMRFGVALDLWAKEDLHGQSARALATPEQVLEIERLVATLDSGGVGLDAVTGGIRREYGHADPAQLSVGDAVDLITRLQAKEAAIVATLAEADLPDALPSPEERVLTSEEPSLDGEQVSFADRLPEDVKPKVKGRK